MKNPTLATHLNRCEKCSKSIYCMKLKPCKDYTPAVSSNFNAEIEIYADPRFLHRDIYAA
jgi:hypothetical protein